MKRNLYTPEIYQEQSRAILKETIPFIRQLDTELVKALNDCTDDKITFEINKEYANIIHSYLSITMKGLDLTYDNN